MRKMFLLICLISSVVYSQLLEENFDYTTGVLTTITANWIEGPTGSTDIEITSGSLSYSDYPSSGIGNKIVLDGGAASRSGVLRAFTSQSGNGTTVYYSYLLKVTSTLDMDTSTSSGEPISNLKVSGSSTLRAAVFVRQGSNSSKFHIGLGKLTSSTAQWYGTELDVNSIYLIVVSYVFQSGDDAVKLWVNPSLSGSEPSADLTQTTGSDAASLGEVQFRQGEFGGDMEIDGIRVATSWSQAPLPVELVSFNGVAKDNFQVELNWVTATEVNNYGFNVERRTENEEWKNIAFVQGNGNSNSPKEYRYTDQPNGGKEFSYRLKQIDFDGSYEYSGEITVRMEEIKEYKLYQNYPNPFNPETIISYSLPTQSYVRLKVYDILGQEVATLVNEIQESGLYNVNFIADNYSLNSGIYFYQLSSGNFSEIKKLILVK